MTKKKKNKSKETATVVKISVEEVPVSRILKQLKLRSKKKCLEKEIKITE